MKNAVVAGLLIGLLAGCATAKAPTKEQFANADFGPQIQLEQFNSMASENLRRRLIDPTSLLFYGATEFTKYWAADSAGVIHYGYFGCYDYNSKNRFGGYAGKSRECVFVEKGKIVQAYVAERDGPRYIFAPNLNTMNGRY